MTKRKKIEPITGTGRDPENQMTVQKSTPLYALWRSELSLAEFKILDTYLSRIDSHNPEKRAVRFEKGEIEQLLGVKKINTPELKERLKHLGTMVQVDDPTKTRSFRLISLFEQAECEQDEDGIWQIDLTCTPSAMKYIFNIENLGYLRYKLRAVTALRSRYAYIMFMYLEKNRFRKSWEVSVDELRHLLNADDEYYQEFKTFNQKVLKRCQKELLEKTECRYTYEPIKKGRNIKTVRFTLETLADQIVEQPDPEDMPGQLSLDLGDQDEHTSTLDFLRGACAPAGGDPEISREEMEQLLQVLTLLPESKLPVHGLPVDDIRFKQYHYLAERYAAMNRAAEKNSIKHRYNYLLKLIRTDAGLL